MGVLMVGGLMVAAGFAAVDPDIGLSKDDQDYKQAYAAAEAGLNDYLYHLGQDNNYFVKCDQVPPPNGTELNPVNLEWTTGAADPRRWRKIPGEKAEYTIELLPAKGYPKCEQNKQETMLDPSTGTIRVRVTGRVPTAKGGDDKRSIIATLRRKGFIDFLYFTDYETADPATYPKTDFTVGQGSAWASANCGIFYRQSRHPSCVEIRFADDDAVNGPLHSNDSILTCNTPVLGRTKNDAIELNGNSPGYVKACTSQNPTFLGTPVWPGGNLDMPPSNQELKTLADPAYRYNGKTHITLTGSTMTVRKFYPGPGSTVTTGVPLPANGVIWVGSPACTLGYKRKQLYDAPTACGDVWISGNYSKELTIAAQNDIIVTDDLRRNASGLLLGLVAQNFVRVYHPVKNWNSSSTDCDNGPASTPAGLPNGPAPDITIEAAILAMDHSFIHDNYYCGNPTGTLNVDGAIAQRYRGPVGTGGTSISTGYLKNYTYNDRLRYREPPFFIDPVQSAWRVARQTEQVPPK